MFLEADSLEYRRDHYARPRRGRLAVAADRPFAQYSTGRRIRRRMACSTIGRSVVASAPVIADADIDHDEADENQRHRQPRLSLAVPMLPASAVARRPAEGGDVAAIGDRLARARRESRAGCRRRPSPHNSSCTSAGWWPRLPPPPASAPADACSLPRKFCASAGRAEEPLSLASIFQVAKSALARVSARRAISMSAALIAWRQVDFPVAFFLI